MFFLAAAVVAVTSTLRLAMQRVSCGILVLILFWIPMTLVAQDDAPQDAEGCKDSAVITRMPGSTIHSCENKEFEQVKVPVAKDADGNVTEKLWKASFTPGTTVRAKVSAKFRCSEISKMH